MVSGVFQDLTLDSERDRLLETVRAEGLDAGAPWEVFRAPSQEEPIRLPPVSRGIVVIPDGARVTCFCACPDHAWQMLWLIGNGAQCEVLTWDQDAQSPRTLVQRGRMGKEASLHWVNATVRSADLRWDLLSRVCGERSVSTVDWLLLGGGHDRQEASVRNSFEAPEGQGEITVHGVAEQDAVLRVLGAIVIGERGGGTRTFLTQNVLMLDATAKVDAVPALEIRTNDVRASHAATVARITEEDLFQFAARGIPSALARQMFAGGFLGSIVQRITSPLLRNLVAQRLERHVVLS